MNRMDFTDWGVAGSALLLGIAAGLFFGAAWGFLVAAVALFVVAVLV